MKEQREMPMLGEVKGLEPAPMELVERCKDELQAIQLCIQLSGLSYDAVCDQLGIDNGHWTRIIHGRAHFPTRKRTALMTLCGNYAPLQYELSALGLPQIQENERQKEIRKLEETRQQADERLRQLKEAAA